MIPTKPSINEAGKQKIMSIAASDATELPQPGPQSRDRTSVIHAIISSQADILPKRDSFPRALSGLSVFISIYFYMTFHL
jgi:hypothetical protein